jgi:hypothetical protein
MLRMRTRFAIFLVFAALLFFSSGCVNRATATVTPGMNFKDVKSFYVVKQPRDSRGLEKLISDNLVKRGFQSSYGSQPTQVDAVVTYVDKWMWDITMYLLELTVTVRNPSNDFPMAVGNSLHTSLTRKSPEEMVDEVMTNIFNRTE